MSEKRKYSETIKPTVGLLEAAFAPYDTDGKQMDGMLFLDQASVLNGMCYLLDEVIPQSFKPISDEDTKEGYFLAKCNNCYWWGTSRLLVNGGRDYESGNCEDDTCPVCSSIEWYEVSAADLKFV